MARVKINVPEVERASLPALLDVGELIAQGTARRAHAHEYGDSTIVIPLDDKRGARVTADWFAAHLDEWDNGESGFSGPSAAMRTSAAEVGEFWPA